MSKEQDYKSHSIYVGQTLMAVCISKGIAEDYARMYYATGTYRIRPTDQADIGFVSEGISTKS